MTELASPTIGWPPAEIYGFPPPSRLRPSFARLSYPFFYVDYNYQPFRRLIAFRPYSLLLIGLEMLFYFHLQLLLFAWKLNCLPLSSTLIPTLFDLFVQSSNIHSPCALSSLSLLPSSLVSPPRLTAKLMPSRTRLVVTPSPSASLLP